MCNNRKWQEDYIDGRLAGADEAQLCAEILDEPVPQRLTLVLRTARED